MGLSLSFGALGRPMFDAFRGVLELYFVFVGFVFLLYCGDVVLHTGFRSTVDASGFQE